MRRWSHTLAVLLLTATTLSTVGCKSRTVYHHYEHTATTGWEKDDTLFFHVPRQQQGVVLHEAVELRTNSRYPFLGISLIVKQTTLPGGVSRTDTLSCTLADEDGNIKGKGVNYYQHVFPLADISLSEGDSVVIAIRHNMIRETLPGIADVGVRLSKM